MHCQNRNKFRRSKQKFSNQISELLYKPDKSSKNYQHTTRMCGYIAHIQYRMYEFNFPQPECMDIISNK